LILILAITSVVGLFYYLRIVVALYSGSPKPVPIRATSRSGVFVVAALSILLIWCGVYPTPLLNLVQSTAAPHDARGAPFATKLNK
jgi:NADH-quinone oxidoreductase subunit N